MIRKTLLILAVFISCASNAQEDSTQFNLKQAFKRNINIGISTGIGGGHVLWCIPAPVVQLRNLSLQAWRMNMGDAEFATYQMEWAPMSLGVSDSKEHYLGISYGFNRSYNFKLFERFFLENHEFLLGINSYAINGLAKRSIKIGLFFAPEQIYFSGTSDASIFLPMAEFSYTWNLFKRPKAQQAPEYTANINQWRKAKLRPWLSKYFNPHISFGLGTDRFLCLPAIGFKSHFASIKVSVFSDGTAGSGGSIAIDLDIGRLPHWRNYASRVNVMAHHFYYGVADGISDDFLYLYGLSLGTALYQINGRHSLNFHVGSGWFAKGGYFGGFSAGSTVQKKVVPLADFSYHLYMFRFGQKK